MIGPEATRLELTTEDLEILRRQLTEKNKQEDEIEEDDGNKHDESMQANF